jgi:hypothetical protein
MYTKELAPCIGNLREKNWNLILGWKRLCVSWEVSSGMSSLASTFNAMFRSFRRSRLSKSDESSLVRYYGNVRRLIPPKATLLGVHNAVFGRVIARRCTFLCILDWPWYYQLLRTSVSRPTPCTHESQDQLCVYQLRAFDDIVRAYATMLIVTPVQALSNAVTSLSA